MTVVLKLWLSFALLWRGLLCALVGRGSHPLSKWWLHRNDRRGYPNYFMFLIGMAFLSVAAGIATNALGWSPLPNLFPSLLCLGLLVFGAQLSTGYAYFEHGLGMTIIKNAKTDTGLRSRAIGALMVVAAAVLLSGLRGWFGLARSPRLLATVIAVCATLMTSLLTNLITGSITPAEAMPLWISTLLGLTAFALILTQTPLWPTSTPEAASVPAPPPLTRCGRRRAMLAVDYWRRAKPRFR